MSYLSGPFEPAFNPSCLPHKSAVAINALLGSGLKTREGRKVVGFSRRLFLRKSFTTFDLIPELDLGIISCADPEPGQYRIDSVADRRLLSDRDRALVVSEAFPAFLDHQITWSALGSGFEKLLRVTGGNFITLHYFEGFHTLLPDSLSEALDGTSSRDLCGPDAKPDAKRSIATVFVPAQPSQHEKLALFRQFGRGWPHFRALMLDHAGELHRGVGFDVVGFDNQNFT